MAPKQESKPTQYLALVLELLTMKEYFLMFLHGVCLHAGLSNVHVPRHRGSGLLVSGGDQIQPEDIGL